MSRLARIGLGVLQVLAFFVITGLLARAYTHWDARSFTAGEAPPAYFPLVAGLPGEAGLRLLRWADIDKARAANPALSFKLAQTAGRFTPSHAGGSVEPVVAFTVLETTGGRQRIEVTAMDDDYSFHSRYATDGATVQAEYLRISGASSALIALFPGLLLTWLLGRLVAWGWRRR